MESRCLIRVLVIDDSPIMRRLLRMTLEECPGIELAGEAADGIAGLEAIDQLQPDLVLLDIEMPRMDGLETLAQIRARRLRVKVIVCSTLTRRGATVTLEALARGAADYMPKPCAQVGMHAAVETLRRDLQEKIRGLFFTRYRAEEVGAQKRARRITQSRAEVLVVGVSTGGPAALEKFLPRLPADFPLPILIVQHMPSLFTSLLAQRLDGLCRLKVNEAHAGQKIERGNAYLARGDWHMQAVGKPVHSFLRLTQTSLEQSCRPSVDVLFRSAAAVYGPGVLAAVLTGMGSDGLAGCGAIAAAGGKILVQDRKTSVVWGMPGVVAEAGLADQVLPLDALADEIVRRGSQPNQPAERP